MNIPARTAISVASLEVETLSNVAMAIQFVRQLAVFQTEFGGRVDCTVSVNILLELFALASQETSMPVTSIGLEAAIPSTTARRAVYKLARLGLIQTSRCSADGRQVLVNLTPETRHRVDRLMGMALTGCSALRQITSEIS